MSVNATHRGVCWDCSECRHCTFEAGLVGRDLTSGIQSTWFPIPVPPPYWLCDQGHIAKFLQVLVSSGGNWRVRKVSFAGLEGGLMRQCDQSAERNSKHPAKAGLLFSLSLCSCPLLWSTRCQPVRCSEEGKQ